MTPEGQAGRNSPVSQVLGGIPGSRAWQGNPGLRTPSSVTVDLAAVNSGGWRIPFLIMETEVALLYPCPPPPLPKPSLLSLCPRKNLEMRWSQFLDLQKGVGHLQILTRYSGPGEAGDGLQVWGPSLRPPTPTDTSHPCSCTPIPAASQPGLYYSLT